MEDHIETPTYEAHRSLCRAPYIGATFYKAPPIYRTLYIHGEPLYRELPIQGTPM